MANPITNPCAPKSSSDYRWQDHPVNASCVAEGSQTQDHGPANAKTGPTRPKDRITSPGSASAKLISTKAAEREERSRIASPEHGVGFRNGSVTLNKEAAQAWLDERPSADRKTLRDPQGMITVTGRASGTGNVRLNQKLAQKRARALATFLRQHGVRCKIAIETRLQPPSTHDNADARSATVHFDRPLPASPKSSGKTGSAKELLALLGESAKRKRHDRVAAGGDEAGKEILKFEGKKMFIEKGLEQAAHALTKPSLETLATKGLSAMTEEASALTRGVSALSKFAEGAALPFSAIVALKDGLEAIADAHRKGHQYGVRLKTATGLGQVLELATTNPHMSVAAIRAAVTQKARQSFLSERALGRIYRQGKEPKFDIRRRKEAFDGYRKGMEHGLRLVSKLSPRQRKALGKAAMEASGKPSASDALMQIAKEATGADSIHGGHSDHH